MRYRIVFSDTRPNASLSGIMINPLFVVLTFAASSFAAEIRFSPDLCVYGGTSAGVIAAVQAAKMGKKVVLVQAGRHLGGMSTEDLGGTDIDNHPGFQNSPAAGGLALEFYRRVSTCYGREKTFEAMLRGLHHGGHPHIP